MFEEVPRTRRGLARLTARRVVLGPFVIGGGMLLAAVGGSVAVAATVITASSIHANDVPPRPAPHPAVAVSAGHRTAAAHRHQPVVVARPTLSLPAANPVPSSNRPASVPPAVVPSPTGPVSSTTRPAARPTLPTGSPSASSSGPVGNALIYVTGYDSAAQRVLFEFAAVDHGAGPNGSDVYRVESTRGYSTTLAADLTITSGGQLCPPAGNRCTTDQLIAAAGAGFFAIAAIDPADQLHSIVEVDNVGTSYAPVSGPPPTPSPSPTNP